MARYNTLSALFLVWAVVAVASPVGRNGIPTKCEDISTFSTEWFLSNELDSFKGPLKDHALFYTRGMTSRAVAYAETAKLVTIWDVWPKRLYETRNTPDNAMRCIHNDTDLRTTFYENMCRAFAKKVDGSAIVMHNEEDYDDPPLHGIWGRVEFETLKGKDSVDWIAKIREDGSQYRVFWSRLLEGIAWLRGQRPLLSKAGKGRVQRRDLQTQNREIRKEDYEFFDSVV